MGLKRPERPSHCSGAQRAAAAVCKHKGASYCRQPALPLPGGGVRPCCAARSASVAHQVILQVELRQRSERGQRGGERERALVLHAVKAQVDLAQLRQLRQRRRQRRRRAWLGFETIGLGPRLESELGSGSGLGQGSGRRAVAQRRRGEPKLL